jgi:glucose/arabinose dehydrogenase
MSGRQRGQLVGRQLVAAAALWALVAVACATDATDRGGAGTPSPIQTTADRPLEIGLEQVTRLEEPVAMAVSAGDPNLYIAQKDGRVVAVGPDGAVRTVLDLTGRVSLGNEQGLLGIAFSPDGRYLYANRTDTEGDTRVTEFVFADGHAVASSERDVLVVDQPYANHNGGAIAFGPDGYLYIALGDGGSGGDPHGNGQSLSTLLGKLLRIDPRPTGGAAYGIPPDNPFVGHDGARPEIWAYGLRNPWRFSFDRETSDLWIGDVGQNAWEEIDMEPAGSAGGRNYGWNVLEGTHPYAGGSTDGMTPPVYEYANGDGTCSVTGGYVYRGSAIPVLDGWYVFADYCLGHLEAIRLRADGSVRHKRLIASVGAITSFGQDPTGEVYAMSRAGGVYRLTSL